MFSPLLPFLITLLLPLLAHALALPPQSPPHISLSSLQNTSSLSTDPGTNCRLDDPTWALDGMLMEHCTAALHRFYVTQVGPHIDQDYEFLAHDARPMYKPVQQVLVTPRKYSVGRFVFFFFEVARMGLEEEGRRGRERSERCGQGNPWIGKRESRTTKKEVLFLSHITSVLSNSNSSIPLSFPNTPLLPLQQN